MKKASIYLILFLIFLGCKHQTNNSWQLKSDFDNMLFPSAIISQATYINYSSSEEPENEVGDKKAWFYLHTENKTDNAKVKIVLKESKFWKESTLNCKLPKNGDYYIFPKMIWKYDALENNKQPSVVNVEIEVFLNGEKQEVEAPVISVRSINECLFGLDYYLGDENNNGIEDDNEFHYEDYNQFYAAYINEDHPIVDQILKEGLETGIVNQYDGYQSGSDIKTIEQVYSLWYVLQKKGIKYSSINNTSQTSDFVFSQRIRPLTQSLTNKQANCVDGTLLFCSLLMAIEIKPIIVLVPEHMFLGFYLDENKENMVFLETTMLGNTTPKPLKKFLEKYSEQQSLQSFIEAHILADDEYNKNFVDKNNKTIKDTYLIDVQEIRKIVKPINF
jgi:hypothetical protein